MFDKLLDWFEEAFKGVSFKGFLLHLALTFLYFEFVINPLRTIHHELAIAVLLVAIWFVREYTQSEKDVIGNPAQGSVIMARLKAITTPAKLTQWALLLPFILWLMLT